MLATQGAAVGATLAYVPRETELLALRLSDGSEAWRLELGVAIASQPIPDMEGVLVPTLDGWILIDDSARMRSALGTDHPARAAVATVDGLVQVDSGGVQRLRLRPVEAAESVWRSDLEGAAAIALTDDAELAVIVDESGAVTALRVADGSVAWVSAESALPFRPAVYREHAIVIGQDHRVRALRLRDGKRSWTSKEIGVRVGAAPVVVDRVIWVPGLDSAVHGFDWGGSHLFRVAVTGRVYIDLQSWGRWVVVSPQYGPWTMVRAPLRRLGPGDPGLPRTVTITSDGELSLRPGVGALGVVVIDDAGSVRLLTPPP